MTQPTLTEMLSFYNGLFIKYFAICGLAALLLTYYKQQDGLWKSVRIFIKLGLNSIVFVIPIYEWFNVVYHGQYFVPKLFIYELILGIIIFCFSALIGMLPFIPRITKFFQWPIIITIFVLAYYIYDVIEMIKLAP